MDNDKLKLEDITFDDFVGEGLTAETSEETPVVKGEQEVKEGGSEIAEIDSLEEEEEEVIEKPKKEIKASVKEEAPEEDEEDEEDSEGVDESTVVAEVLSKLGYEFEEEFEDTSEGLVQMSKAVAEKMAESQLDTLFNTYPEIQKHLDYVMNGGKTKDWLKMSNQIEDFGDISISEGDIRTQRAVLGQYFKLKGHDAEFINEMLDDYIESDKLYIKSKKAKNALSDYYAEEREKATAKEKEMRVQEQKDQKSFWDNVHNTIQDSRDFSGITVQEKDKKKFFDYLSKPGADGVTAREKAHKESSTEIKLAIDYLMFKEFNLQDIIATKAKTSNAQSLRKKIKSSPSVKTARRSKRKSGFDIDSLDLNLNNL
jgi:hypothetical protein